MKQITELDFIDLKSLRDENINRVEVLDRVGTLVMMPNTEFANMHQVAAFYQTELATIETVVRRNLSELEEDGFKTFKQKEVIALLNIQNECLTNKSGKKMLNIQNECLTIPNRGMRLFPKRAILRVGMLLRDSNVAKQIRTYLLDVEQIAQEVAPGVIDMALGVMSEERELKADLAEAILAGDVIAVAEIMKHIKDYEEDVASKRIIALTEENAELIADNQNLMAQYENIAEEKDTLEVKLNCMCNRTEGFAQRRALCATIIEAYGIQEFNSEEEGYKTVFNRLNDGYAININARKVANPKKAYIDLLTPPELMLLEMLLRKLVVTFDLKDFYND